MTRYNLSWRHLAAVALLVYTTCGCQAEDSDSNATCYLCEVAGLCGEKLTDGRCTLESTADCRNSLFCKLYGWCSAGKDRCVAASAADCGQSQLCNLEGKCGWKKDGILCIPNSSGCSQFCDATSGKFCSMEPGPRACHARRNETPCESTFECLQFGHCSELGGLCVASTNSDCEKSSVCTLEGKCVAVDGVCLPSSDEWCRSRPDCLESGNCVLGEFFACEATAADCNRVCNTGPYIPTPSCSLTAYNLCM
jgi:hypothetical protein